MRRHKTRPTTPKKAELVEELNTLRRQRARLQSAERKRKQMEAALQEAREALERRVEERTAELSQANSTLKLEVVERTRAEESLRDKTAQLEAITASMTGYLETGDWHEASATLIRSALQQTESVYGFVGVVAEGPVLRVLAYEGIVWDHGTNREFYEDALRSYRERGYLEFTKFENLFGRVITTGQVVRSNSPSRDPRGGGIPAGHPPLLCFLGVPILRKNQVVGMIGVANRPGGYTGVEQDKIGILTQAAGVLYENYRQREHEIALEAERERAEATLARYKHIVAGTTDFMAFIDRNYRYQQINPSYLHAFGKKWEEIVGNTGEQLFGTHVFETVLKPRQDRCFSGQEVSYETWLDFPVRGRRCLDVHYHPFREPGGAISGIVVSARDITERKQAEEQLRTAQAHLQHLITSSPAVIYSCKPSGDYGASFITENIRSQLGYEAREFIEDPRFWADHIHPDDAPRVFAELARLYDKGPCVLEYRFKHKNGTYRWMHDEVRLVQDQAGNSLEIVGCWVDISERKRAEESLQASEQQLRQLLEDREQLHEDLHDGILQSLFAVGLTLSATKPLVERAPERAVTQVEQSMVQLQEVIQDIRAFITDTVPPRLQEQDFKTALASLISSLGPTPPLEIQVDVDDAAADCLTDEQRLHLLSIAQEALSNSVRHSGGHHGRMSLRREGNVIRFEVQDDGVGFYVSSPKAEEHGLHNMRSRAEKIGARLELHSNPGKGTQITVSLPKEA